MQFENTKRKKNYKIEGKLKLKIIYTKTKGEKKIK